MRAMNAWLVTATLAASLVLVCASVTGSVGISLPVAALGGLGLNAALLLWIHREKMEDILGRRRG